MKATNEQLKDVKWWDANQPSKSHVWIEHNAPEANSQSGWFFIKPLGGEIYTSVDGHVRFPLQFGPDIGTIHHKPKDTPYQPEVGDSCEIRLGDNWEDCEPVFIGEQVMVLLIGGAEVPYSKSTWLRPKKTDEEFFLEAAKELIPEMDVDDIRLVKELAKVGARFK